MQRTFSPVDLVQLPRIDANGSVALATALEAAATPFQNLPSAILDCLTQIGSDKQILLQALAKTPTGLLTVKEIDRRVDRVAGALHDVTAAWATLAEFMSEGEKAKVLHERLFADGRRFLNLKVQEEWAAIETKLATVERENLKGSIEAIGAIPIYSLLKQFQTEYGAIIGTTQPLEEAPEIRDSKTALLDSIRSYVIQVAASVKRGAPDTATRADALLKPVREWESTKSAPPQAPT